MALTNDELADILRRALSGYQAGPGFGAGTGGSGGGLGALGAFGFGALLGNPLNLARTLAQGLAQAIEPRTFADAIGAGLARGLGGPQVGTAIGQALARHHGLAASLVQGVAGLAATAVGTVVRGVAGLAGPALFPQAGAFNRGQRARIASAYTRRAGGRARRAAKAAGFGHRIAGIAGNLGAVGGRVAGAARAAGATPQVATALGGLAVAAGVTATVVAGLTVAVVAAVPALAAFAQGINESNRHLAAYNGRIAAAFATLDLHRFGRRFELAGATADSTVGLATAVDKMEQRFQGLSVLFANAKNELGTAAAEAAGRIAETITSLLEVTVKILEFLTNNMLTRDVLSLLDKILIGWQAIFDWLKDTFGIVPAAPAAAKIQQFALQFFVPPGAAGPILRNTPVF